MHVDVNRIYPEKRVFHCFYSIHLLVHNFECLELNIHVVLKKKSVMILIFWTIKTKKGGVKNVKKSIFSNRMSIYINVM